MGPDREGVGVYGEMLIVFFVVVIVAASVLSWKLIMKIDRVVLSIVSIVLLIFSLSVIVANRSAFEKMEFAQREDNKCRAAYSEVHRVALSYQDYLLEHGALVVPNGRDEKVTVYGPLPVRTVGLTQWHSKPLEMREASNVDK